MKAPARLQWRMAGNALVDAVGGLLPLAGDAFDVWYKANIRNLALLTGYLEMQLAPPKSRKTGRLWLWLLLLALMGWSIAVMAHVLQQALSTSRPMGIFYALGYLVFSIVVLILTSALISLG
jgi:hypothetical protein